MLHKATEYDWVGDPVPGSFHLLHNRAGRDKLLDLNDVLPEDARALQRVSGQRRRSSAESRVQPTSR